MILSSEASPQADLAQNSSKTIIAYEIARFFLATARIESWLLLLSRSKIAHRWLMPKAGEKEG